MKNTNNLERQDDRDIPAKWIGVAGLGLMGLIIATFLLSLLCFMLLVFVQNKWASPRAPMAEEKVLPPEPRLQTEPREDLQRIRREERRLLTTYGWKNKNAGIVRIPVEKAMDIVLAQGFPARPQEKTA